MRTPLLLLSALVLCAPLALAQTPRDVRLRYAAFDPQRGEPAIPVDLLAPADSRLFLVQLEGAIRETYRAELGAVGARVHRYVSDATYLVRMDRSTGDAVRSLPFVRWAGPFHPAYRLDPAIIADLLTMPVVPADQYDVLLVAPGEDAAAFRDGIARIGGRLDVPPGRGILAQATLTGEQLLAVASLDQVLWIDRPGPISTDMDIVRIVGGATVVEALGGHTGRGVRGHVLEGIHDTHPEFAATAFRGTPIGLFLKRATTHGTQTYGIMFSRGVNPMARGIIPDAQGLYSDYQYVLGTSGRYALVADLVDPTLPHQAMFQTASWGYSRTTQYTSRSAEMDQILFDLDIPITQAFGNSGGLSIPDTGRPVAWSKNIITVGGFFHYDNTDPSDDCFCNGSSAGPALDGRIKPELSAFYDATFTANGPSGYAEFGGTSGSCPIVAGYVGLALELFTDGLFGYPAAPSWMDRFPYRPHYTTTKALLVNTARQRQFSGLTHDMTRNHQGWGMPSAGDLYAQRDTMLVIDELDVLVQGQSRSYWVFVPPGTEEFRATMTHSDPPSAPLAMTTRINSLDLRVSAPDGTRYWGNNGLQENMFSVSGGVANDLDTLENVWLRNPPRGVYVVNVRAPVLRQDGHVETSAVDADYALAVSGLGGMRDRTGMALDLRSSGAGDFAVSLTGVPAGYAGGFTLLSANTSRVLSTGNLFGLEIDALTLGTIGAPPAVGNLFSFVATPNPGAFPNRAFQFPPAVALALSGLTLDGVALVYGPQSAILGVSNVARVTLQ